MSINLHKIKRLHVLLVDFMYLECLHARWQRLNPPPKLLVKLFLLMCVCAQVFAALHACVYIHVLYMTIWACAKRCSARTIHFLVLNASSGLSFLWTNITLSERVCIKEIIKINLTPKVSFELVKYENLHQVRAKNRQRKGGHFGCTASVVVLFASFFFRQFSLCCLTGHSQSFLMLLKIAHNYL